MAANKPTLAHCSIEIHDTEVLPQEADILFYGDSSLTCRHPGNLSFVQCVNRCLHHYCESDDMGKIVICNGIVEAFAARLPPARFIMRDSISREWVRLSKDEAIVVTAHAFVMLATQEAQEIDAMIVEELASHSQESTGSLTFETATSEEVHSSNAMAGEVGHEQHTEGRGSSTPYPEEEVADGPCLTIEVCMETEVTDAATISTPIETKLAPRQHARCVSMDFETIHLAEVQHDCIERPPLRRRVSESSQSDIAEPILDQHSEAYWEDLNTTDFEDLKYFLDCDDEVLVS